MLKKKLLVINTTILLGLGTLAVPSAFAETTSQKIQEANQNITEAQNKLAILEEQVQRIDQAMKENSDLIAQTEKDIKTTNTEIEKLNSEIKVLKENITKRTEILKERAVSLQEAGGQVSYIEVLAGSQSFGDFVNRVVAVSQIAGADNDLIKQHESDKKELEEKQSSVEKKLAQLTSKKSELDGMKAMMQEQKQKNTQLKTKLGKEAQDNISLKNRLEAHESQVSAPSQSSGNTGGGSNSSLMVKYTAPTNSGSLNDVIKAGYKYIGHSAYKFGGGRTQSDIDRGLFDCSGFVHWAFAQAGISVGASTDSLKNSGTRVSRGEMRPGDLVFFNTYKTDGHVGIYLGGGQFIGSQDSTGVAIANMSSGYWADNFNGRVVRIK